MALMEDINGSINLLNSGKNTPHYRRVKLFPNFSLKHFKKYKLDGKNALTKITNIEEVFDLLSYNVKVTTFSTNPLDYYFLDLLFEAHKLNRKEYLGFVLSDYKVSEGVLNEKIYQKIKDGLNEDTKEYFDELYSYCRKKQIPINRLLSIQPEEKDVLQMYIRNHLSNRFQDVNLTKKPDYWNMSTNEVVSTFKDSSFDFINYSILLDSNPTKAQLEFQKESLKLLKENGKIQSFISRDKLEIENFKRIETRSFLDPYTEEKHGMECKKDYAYMYTNSQN